MKNWKISLVTYIIVFLEIMASLFYYYGSHFMTESILPRCLDICYYIAVIGWFVGISIYTVRTNEFIQRETFFSKRSLVDEIKKWKEFLGKLPEPIIFTHHGEISFFNSATLEFLKIQQNENEDFDTQKMEVETKLANLKQKGTDKTLKSIMENREIINANGEHLFVQKNHREKKRLTLKTVKTRGNNDNNEVMEYIFHDVTALKELERNKAKEQCFDIMLATVSHDIRTPLNLILGVLDVLSDCINSEKGKEQLCIARSCGQRMMHYLKGLSFIREINTGKLSITKKLFSPSEIANSVINTIAFSAQAKNLSLNINISPSIPTVICSDKEIYAIILQNLLENAIKYTFTGGVIVDLLYDKVSEMLLTDVTDTGIGMTPDQINNIGILFNKSGSQRSLNPQGAGVGLYLTKTLANKLDGELIVKSTPNEGTTAHFKIKCYKDEDDEFKENPPPIYTKCSDNTLCTFICTCTKILIVDDEPFNLMVLSAYLNSIGLKADKAENGEIALKLIKNKAESGNCCSGYSVVFMDINMPVMDGVEATIRICDMIRENKIPKCHVVAVTAAIGLDKPNVCAMYIKRGFSELCKTI